jgi:hypothetical protein
MGRNPYALGKHGRRASLSAGLCRAEMEKWAISRREKLDGRMLKSWQKAIAPGLGQKVAIENKTHFAPSDVDEKTHELLALI